MNQYMKATSNKAWKKNQPHLGKSGFRPKKIQHYLGQFYYLVWEKKQHNSGQFYKSQVNITGYVLGINGIYNQQYKILVCLETGQTTAAAQMVRTNVRNGIPTKNGVRLGMGWMTFFYTPTHHIFVHGTNVKIVF